MRPHAPAVHWIFAFASALIAAGHSHAQFPSQNLGSPLVTVSADALPAQLRDSVTALAPDEQVWKAMSTTDHVRLEAVPVSPTRTVNLLLSRIDPFTADARLVTATIDATGNDDVHRTGCNRLGRKLHRLLKGSALSIKCHAGH